MDFSIPDRLLVKSFGANQHKIHSLYNHNVCVFDDFAIKWSTKCASSTICKVHWNVMRRPAGCSVSWDESFNIQHQHIKLNPKLQYTIDKPLYAFYRDPVERFVSSCNFILEEIKNTQSRWPRPTKMLDMIRLVQEYNVVRTSDIFWPQSIYLIKPDLYKNVYKLSYLNRFFKSKGIDIKQHKSEKYKNTKGPFSVSELSRKEESLIMDLYHMDYLLGWGK